MTEYKKNFYRDGQSSHGGRYFSFTEREYDGYVNGHIKEETVPENIAVWCVEEKMYYPDDKTYCGTFAQCAEYCRYEGISDGKLVAYAVDRASGGIDENVKYDGISIREALKLLPPKEFDLGYGMLGNGMTVWNRAVTLHGDYEYVAHIDPDRTVTFYDKSLPYKVKREILREAERGVSDCYTAPPKAEKDAARER